MWKQTHKFFCATSLPKLGFFKETRCLFLFSNDNRKFQSRMKSDNAAFTKLFQPAPIKTNEKLENIGLELSGTINKTDVLKVLNKLCLKKEIIALCTEHGLDDYIRQQTFSSFRKYCFQVDRLPPDLYIRFYDISQGAGHVDDIFPYLLKHARDIFPHLNCMNDLRKISDLTNPANWYPAARAKGRKIIFHAGPTNSGKTYQAMQRFLQAKTGIYCGPLKLLASEVFVKSNEQGTLCDLVTGEERRFGHPEEQPANHVACTIEMTPLNKSFEVAIIDEIQLLKEPARGWAWTRAFLGVDAEEVHVCGEAGAFSLLEKLCETTGDVLESNHYKRLTELTVENRALETLENIQPGDCVVCFSKNDLYKVSQQLESMGKEVAVIYGSLPPNTKLKQAAKFNDPKNSCKIMVATDAIGMGLNLSIRRVVFYSMAKQTMTENGKHEKQTLSVSSALQIAGRAGRYGTQWENGYVTTFNKRDLEILQQLLSQSPEQLVQAGLHPTAEQIELFAYHLPSASLSNLLDIFVQLSTVDDSLYFMCQIEGMKELAQMIQHVPLSLRARYVFCCAPINLKEAFVCAMFLKIANQYSKYEPVTLDWIAKECNWPLSVPKTIAELIQLENVFDVMDIYLWLSYRFTDMFPHGNQVRQAQTELDKLIQTGVQRIAKLLKSSNNFGDTSRIVDSLMKASIEAPLDGPARELIQIKVNGKPQTIKRGSVTEQLILQGVLTPAIAGQLQEEWATESKDFNVKKRFKNKNRSQKK